MQKTITARHFELTQALKDHSEQKLNQLSEQMPEILEAALILEVEENPKVLEGQIAELNVHVPGENITSKVASDDLYKSIDQVIVKVVKLLSKHKDKAHSS